MPSGSHGGRSGGSHGGFTGGGSFSSSGGAFSRRSSHSHSRGHVHIGPRRFRWFGGRTVIITSGAQSALAVLAFFIVAAALVMVAFISDIGRQKEYVNMIKEERQFYLAMIADAEEDQSLQIDAKVTGVYYKQEFGKYYITYLFGTGNYEGYTFSIYDMNEYPKKNDIIKIAVDDTTIDSTTDSIPMDYKNFELEDDGEYLYARKQVRSKTAYAVIAGLVVVGCIGGVVLIFVKAKKEKEEEKAKEEKEEQEKIEAEKKKFCQYCGAKVDENDKTCGKCGAGTQ